MISFIAKHDSDSIATVDDFEDDQIVNQVATSSWRWLVPDRDAKTCDNVPVLCLPFS